MRVGSYRGVVLGGYGVDRSGVEEGANPVGVWPTWRKRRVRAKSDHRTESQPAAKAAVESSSDPRLSDAVQLPVRKEVRSVCIPQRSTNAMQLRGSAQSASRLAAGRCHGA